MNFRVLIGVGAIGCLAALPSQAAVTVLGNNTLAQSCYQAAEFGGDPAPGIETCTFAVQNEPLTAADKAATYVNRGILRSRSGNPQGALEDYNLGLSIDGDLGEGYVDRGATYIVLQRYDDALADINKGIDMGAHRPQIAYYDRAIVHEAMGDIRAAYQDYKKAVELAPDFTLATEQLTRFKVVRKSSDGT
jgi:tetratricopeptide (TPR) repeat protein